MAYFRCSSGADKGFYPTILVTGIPQEDTVYAEKDGKRYNSKWTNNGHLIGKLPELGTYVVTASNGNQVSTQDVLVDLVADYTIEMGYWIINTQFDRLESDWIMSGGTISHGNGLYVDSGWSGSTRVSLSPTNYSKSAYVEIPIPETDKFLLEWSTNVVSSTTPMGGAIIEALKDEKRIFAVGHTDNVSGAYNQTLNVQFGNTSTLIDSRNTSNTENITIEHNVEFDNGHVFYSQNYNSTTITEEITDISVNKIRIWFVSAGVGVATRVPYMKCLA